MPGYVDVGIEMNSENQGRAIGILQQNSLPIQILTSHVLNSNYLRLDIRNQDVIDDLLLSQQVFQEGKFINIQQKLNDAQKQAIRDIYRLYSDDGNLKENNLNLFMAEWDKRPNLKTLREWWDTIPSTFIITSVGKVLAHSNAQRCDKTLPPLD